VRSRTFTKLEINDSELLSYTVYKRSYDARHKKNIFFIYSLDVDTSKNTQILEQFSEDTHVKTRPDDRYRFVAQAPENISERPLVVGLGPCGLHIGFAVQLSFTPEAKGIYRALTHFFTPLQNNRFKAHLRQYQSAQARQKKFYI
jgi:uncharacterized FAD-dependent dehydrogenase